MQSGLEGQKSQAAMNSSGPQCPFLSAEGRCAVISMNAQDGGWSDNDKPFDWTILKSFAVTLKCYYRLLGAIFAIALILAAFVYFFTSRTYTAVAVLGPPGPSPTGMMMTSIGGGGFASGLTSKLLGSGGASGGNDPYQNFQQLLPSTKLSQVLIERDHILQTVFYKRWDFETNRWKQPGLLGSLKNGIKGLLNLPITNRPNVDDLTRFFDSHLDVGHASISSGGLLGSSSPYINVSFKYGDPREAERLLGVILFETDQIIREDQRHNVTSRIAFLRQELSSQSIAADERTALISILSDQEQLLSMIEADQRYASTLVVPPYASLKPTSPPQPGTLIVVALFASVFAWCVCVSLSLHSGHIRKFIAWSRRNTEHAHGNPDSTADAT
jgi:hypothetical protein